MVSFTWSLEKLFVKGGVTRGNYRIPLRVFELKSKTRNALPSQMLRKKSSSAPCYTVFEFLGNIVARKIDVASSPV